MKGRSVTALEYVESGSVVARSDRLRVDAGHGVTARTSAGADLPLVREDGGRVRVGPYLLPQSVPAGAGPWTLQLASDGTCSWV